jgi:hypothetical protein
VNRMEKSIPAIFIATLLSVTCASFAWAAKDQNTTRPNPRHPWPALIQQAEARGLPTGFLKHISPTFVTIIFEDLRTYAAEYHPENHTMILNMRLSFNEAGGALADLARMTHHDLGLLYHELFHAYLDYLYATPDPDTLAPDSRRVLDQADHQLQCRFRFVRINPIRQLKDTTELRFLSKEDAWEVLNETWAVFIGWAVWTKLELFHGQLDQAKWTPALVAQWTQRLTDALNSGELLGYYEPDDPEERRVARKRFIAPSNGLTAEDVERLLVDVLEESPELVQASKEVLEHHQAGLEPPPACE